MSTSFEGIDWNEMPEGAVEFSLTDNVFSLTWYDADKQFWARSIDCWKYDNYPDDRTKYKVADYRPSTKENEQVFVPTIGEPCTAVVDAVFGGIASLNCSTGVGSLII